MSILGSLLRAAAPAPDADDYYLPYSPHGLPGSILPSAESALAIAAVYACVNVIAQSLASVPLKIYKERKSGTKDEATDHPLYPTLHLKPGVRQSAYEFFETGQSYILLNGNAVAPLTPGIRGSASQLEFIHPNRVVINTLPTGQLQYKINNASGGTDVYREDQVFHMRGLSLDGGRTGVTPITYAAAVIYGALEAQNYGNRFFKNNAQPGGIIKHKGRLGEDAAKRLKKSWQDSHGGNNLFTVTVLEESMDFQQLTMSNRDAQFLESRMFSANEIARLYRVPPHKIGILDRATFANIEHQALEFITDCMLAWFRRWEQRITIDLLDGVNTPYSAEFLITGLLRGDSKTRYEVYAQAINWGILNPNECRAFENLNPREGGDEYLQPVNMVPAGTLPAPKPTQTPPAGDGGGGGDGQDMGGGDGPAGPGQENATAEQRAIEVLIGDVSDRLVGAEARAIARHIVHAASDPVGFDAWRVSFYSSHQEYVRKALAPLALIAPPAQPLGSLVQQLVADGFPPLRHGAAVPSLDNWRPERRQAIQRILQGAYR